MVMEIVFIKNGKEVDWCDPYEKHVEYNDHIIVNDEYCFFNRNFDKFEVRELKRHSYMKVTD